MSAELKPCPFCGGDASIHAAYEWPRREGPFYVGCDKCPASLGDQWRETEGGHAPDHVFATEAEATAAWNRRAAELDASGDAEPAGVVNWTGEGGTSVTAALYRPLPHGTKLYTRPPVESAPVDVDALAQKLGSALFMAGGSIDRMNAQPRTHHELREWLRAHFAAPAAAQENAP